MNSPEQKKHSDEDPPSAKPLADEDHPGDKQSQATSEEFEEEGMGVAPKE